MTTRTARTASTNRSSVVESADGTLIAVTISGSGRPLVLVPGTSADHTSWRLVQPYLEPAATVHAVDRRGRGGSGDRPDYQVEREYADIAAVLDAAAAAYRGPVDLVGHSYGGMVCFGAAARSRNVRRLVLYEGWALPDPALRAVDTAVMVRVERLLAAGERDELLRTFFREVVQMGEEELRPSRRRRPGRPGWPRRTPCLASCAPSSGRCSTPTLQHGSSPPSFSWSASGPRTTSARTPRRSQQHCRTPGSSSCPARPTWPTRRPRACSARRSCPSSAPDRAGSHVADAPRQAEAGPAHPSPPDRGGPGRPSRAKALTVLEGGFPLVRRLVNPLPGASSLERYLTHPSELVLGLGVGDAQPGVGAALDGEHRPGRDVDALCLEVAGEAGRAAGRHLDPQC